MEEHQLAHVLGLEGAIMDAISAIVMAWRKYISGSFESRNYFCSMFVKIFVDHGPHLCFAKFIVR